MYFSSRRCKFYSRFRIIYNKALLILSIRQQRSIVDREKRIDNRINKFSSSSMNHHVIRHEQTEIQVRIQRDACLNVMQSSLIFRRDNRTNVRRLYGWYGRCRWYPFFSARRPPGRANVRCFFNYLPEIGATK